MLKFVEMVSDTRPNATMEIKKMGMDAVKIVGWRLIRDGLARVGLLAGRVNAKNMCLIRLLYSIKVQLIWAIGLFRVSELRICQSV